MVKPHGLEALATVRAFLSDRIVGAVPAELVGEMRAAVKLLRAVEDELGVLPGMLHEECRALLDLLRRGSEALEEATPDALGELLGAATTPRELFDVQRTLRGRLGELLPRLQDAARGGPAGAATARRVLLDAYAALGDCARTRGRWQSVFAD